MTSLLPWLLVALLLAAFVFVSNNSQSTTLRQTAELVTSHYPQILVSYSYFEKDEIQKDNFDFFLLAAAGIGSHYGADPNVDYYIVLNGDACTPCAKLDPILGGQELAPQGSDLLWVRHGPSVMLLKRAENEGMDFAAHNSTLTYVQDHLKMLWTRYKYFLFLNSSVKGPFTPKYYTYHWTTPFTSRLQGAVKAVGSSLVCLPEVDAGGPGPKLESWAFATDAAGLSTIVNRGVFHTRVCKLCTDGVVVMGEYGITTALFERNYTIDTLMAKYGDVEWRDKSNWMCNNQVHPSRHGTYDGISMHPYETVFVKASWHVGEPFVNTYAAWTRARLQGMKSTAGVFDEPMYRYAIQPYAQDKHPLIEKAYAVGPRA